MRTHSSGGGVEAAGKEEPVVAQDKVCGGFIFDTSSPFAILHSRL